MSDRNTIVLKGNIEERYDEGVVGAAITSGECLPGMLLEQNVDEEFVPHTEANAACEMIVAVEDDFRGMTVEGTLPGDGVVAGGVGVGYITDDKIRFHRAQKGDVLQMILNAGESADPSKYGTSNGDGTLKVVTSTNHRLVKFLETLDLTAESDNAFIKVVVV